EGTLGLSAALLSLDAGSVFGVGAGEGHVEVAVGVGVVSVVIPEQRVVAAAVDRQPGGHADLLTVLLDLHVDRPHAGHRPGAAEAVRAVPEVRGLPHGTGIEGIGDVDGDVPRAAPSLPADQHRPPAAG